ncbi:hypothetical protein BZG36_04324 [Bifiguratus adelaidae]|uniref:Uncharacterized protein n=1 Tax=Bifiguratus adelaidae TaxID=1938954 RepID=A0A261XV04_9FUNG|nr:hypothetical protein BZG36_04324 [Bifiguratus adelaidae]
MGLFKKKHTDTSSVVEAETLKPALPTLSVTSPGADEPSPIILSPDGVSTSRQDIEILYLFFAFLAQTTQVGDDSKDSVDLDKDKDRVVVPVNPLDQFDSPVPSRRPSAPVHKPSNDPVTASVIERMTPIAEVELAFPDTGERDGQAAPKTAADTGVRFSLESQATDSNTLGSSDANSIKSDEPIPPQDQEKKSNKFGSLFKKRNKITTPMKEKREGSKSTLGRAPLSSSQTSVRSVDSHSSLVSDKASTTKSETRRNKLRYVKPSAIWTCQFSKCGKYLGVGGQDCIVRVYTLREGAKAKAKAKATDSDDAQHTDDNVETDREVEVFEEVPIREYRGHTADVLDLSWSKNTFLLSSSMDKTIRLWHISRNECLCVFQHLDFVTAVAFHPKDDRFFLSGSLDCKLRLWNVPEKKVAFWQETPDEQLITAASFTHNGQYACIGTCNGNCLFYEVDGLKFSTSISVHDSAGSLMGSHDKSSKQSLTVSSKTSYKITGIEAMPGVDATDEYMLITSNDSKLRLLNFREKQVELKFRGLENGSSQIKATFSDNGQRIICGSENSQVFVWATEQCGFYHPSLHPQVHTTSPHSDALATEADDRFDKATAPSKMSNWFRGRARAIEKHGKIAWESFEAGSDVITCAIFAPATTKQYLYLTKNDAIYTETVIPNTFSPPSAPSTPAAASPETQPVKPAFTFPDGDIIITSGYHGTLKTVARALYDTHRAAQPQDSTAVPIPPPSTALATTGTLLSLPPLVRLVLPAQKRHDLFLAPAKAGSNLRLASAQLAWQVVWRCGAIIYGSAVGGAVGGRLSALISS